MSQKMATPPDDLAWDAGSPEELEQQLRSIPFFRNLPAGDTTTLPTDLWLKRSPAGGAAFGPDTHVAGSFNMLVAPNAGGFFVGDYEAIGVNGSTFLPFFVQTNCTDNSCTGNRTDVYATSS